LDASLTIPMDPLPPPGQVALGPGRPLPPGANRFAYMLLGEKPPGSVEPVGLRPGALLSASHATTAQARGGSGIMAPVYPPPNAAAMRHMTELNPKSNANADEELAER
jgi:cell division protein FtsI (penicillin-binding protein 3)